MSKKNAAAVSLGRKRWAGVSAAERRRQLAEVHAACPAEVRCAAMAKAREALARKRAAKRKSPVQ